MDHVDEHPEYLTTAEYAALRRVKPQSIRKERKKRRGPPFFRIGQRCLYRRAEVDAWIATHRVDPSATYAERIDPADACRG